MDIDTLRFTCTGIKEGERFPVDNTGRGRDLSPEFLIENLSPAAKTLAITLEDIQHPLFQNFTHWLIWNIPAANRVPGAIPGGRLVPGLGNARQGIGYGCCRYAGPKPPKGRRHLYRFTVYALDTALAPPLLPTKGRFVRQAKEHILQKGQLTGWFASN